MRTPPLLFLVTLTTALLSGAEPTLSPYCVHEKRTQLPHGWTRTRRHDASSIVPLRFALKQRNIEDIGNYLDDVSHPESPNYGKHWTAEDIVRTFAPSEETIDTVRDWLFASGIGEGRLGLSRNKGWIQLDATVEEAEQLMKTEYNVYTHVSGKEHIGCDVYHLPEHVQRHVDFVMPSVHFDAKLARRSGDDTTSPTGGIGQPGVSITSVKTGGTVSDVSGALDQCDKYTTPSCLRALYRLDYKPVATGKNSYGIVEYTPQAYLQSDLQMFASNYSIDLIGKQPHLVSIDGGIIQTTRQSDVYNGESNLDLQYGMTLVTGSQTVTLYQVGDIVEGASFNNFLDAIDGRYCTYDGGDQPPQDDTYPDLRPGGYKGHDCGTMKPAHVISTSYGYDEHGLTPFYAERQCNEYAKLGLMGVTFLFSSGDYGVAGNRNRCLDLDGSITAGGIIFNPGFPATCPYVTSVGATMVKPGATVYDPEVACMETIYSGGGFSNYFPMPSYQKDAVNHYLTHHRPDYPPSIWNSTGKSRAFPDISANGANYVVALNGQFRLLYGTSASTPVVGAILTMINDARLAIGKGPIGFINPTIYLQRYFGAFNDITEGTNPGCGTAGYNATEGWDPVTGLGTPNFSRLRDFWLALP